MAVTEDIFIGDYMDGLSKASSSDITSTNGLLMRTLGGMKELGADSYALRDLMIAPWKNTTGYGPGELVLYSNKVYRAKDYVNGGTTKQWDASKWEEVSNGVAAAIPIVLHSRDNWDTRAVTSYLDAVKVSDDSIVLGFYDNQAGVTDAVTLVALNKESIKAANSGKVLAVNADGTGVELITPTSGDIPTKTSELTNDSGFNGDHGITDDNLTLENAGKCLAVNSTGDGVELVTKASDDTFAPASIGKVTIGSKQYGYYKVGHYYWMTEDLDEELDGIISEDYENDYGRGKLYDVSSEDKVNSLISAVKALNVPTGWKLPDTLVYADSFTYDEDYGVDLFKLSVNDAFNSSFGDYSGGNKLNLTAQISESSGTISLNYTTLVFDRYSSQDEVAYQVMVGYSVTVESGEAIIGGLDDSYENVYGTVADITTKSGVRLVCHEDDFVAPIISSARKGLVPAPQIGDSDKFLSGDGTFKAVNIPEAEHDIFYFSFPEISIYDGVYGVLVYRLPAEEYPSALDDLITAIKENKTIIGISNGRNISCIGATSSRGTYTCVFNDVVDNVKFLLEIESSGFENTLRTEIVDSNIWFDTTGYAGFTGKVSTQSGMPYKMSVSNAIYMRPYLIEALSKTTDFRISLKHYSYGTNVIPLVYAMSFKEAGDTEFRTRLRFAGYFYESGDTLKFGQWEVTYNPNVKNATSYKDYWICPDGVAHTITFGD